MSNTRNWTSYVDTKARAEHERLALLEEVFDPFTARLLDRLGVRPGWDCLEVGAGAGSVARLLAERAGPEHVVATDMAVDLLTPLADAGVRVLRHDVTADEAPGEFDLIHARMVLEHVSEREKAVRRMASWLRPGGVLVVESATPVPELAGHVAVARCLTALGEILGASVGTDPGWARRLPRPLEDAGLVDCGAEGYAVSVRGGSPAARWMAATHRLVEEPALARGVVSRADLTAAYTAYADPSYVDYAWMVVGAHGRRPT
ncbi:class I SAM-dependent methyltransferase [Actinophytocola xanthii]|uniref:class I SAM-dependent methyltransferase n=1 Tax=Actinophytocola xanthii TaxID=1912961 RepID=UPI0013015294|nr:class I SAM-dependent methyltransferase [Actinophytocola xanthii]